MNKEKLYICFQLLFKQFSSNESLLEEYWLELVGFYSENHRTYHNLRHLGNMFEVLAKHQKAFELSDYAIFEWSIFYHDVIYNVSRNSKNEEKSADLAVERLKQLGVSKERQDLCYQLIVSTQKHQPLIAGMDNKLLIDLDLEILGKSEEEYVLYTQQIRKEYKQYPSFLYNKGRKKAMKQFLECDRVYHTDVFYDLLEQQARDNILREING